MVDIRAETPEDVEAVAQVEHSAFGGPAEANLVNRLRELGQLAVSLIAVSESRVVGHIAFSPMILSQGSAGLRAVGLAPLAVLPAHQGHGIGSQLVRTGLRTCAERGWDLAFVLGDPAYYPRFGFTDALAHGLRWDRDAPAGAFMVAELRPGALGEASGVARYHAAFDEL
jgi:putative acetyltransferase